MGHVGSTSAPAVKDTGLISVTPFSETAGSGATKILIPAATNVAGLLLWYATLSADAGGNPASNFQVTDQIVDDTGFVWHAVNIAMNMGGDAQNVPLGIDLKGAMVPPGNAVSLVNGGAGGTTALRQVTAVLLATILV